MANQIDTETETTQQGGNPVQACQVKGKHMIS